MMMMIDYRIEKGAGAVLVRLSSQSLVSGMKTTSHAFVLALLRKAWWEHAEGWSSNVVVKFLSMAMANLYAEQTRFYSRFDATSRGVTLIVRDSCHDVIMNGSGPSNNSRLAIANSAAKPWWEHARGWEHFVKGMRA